eukprot:COSAG01_NODE_1539_length_9983_cov_211.998381_2_plen_88_part_00
MGRIVLGQCDRVDSVPCQCLHTSHVGYKQPWRYAAKGRLATSTTEESRVPPPHSHNREFGGGSWTIAVLYLLAGATTSIMQEVRRSF